MSSNSEIKYKNLIDNKPYLTKAEVSILLGKKGKNLDKKILNLLKKKELILLKKGLYVSKIYLIKKPSFYEEYLANILYPPSYLSLEYVLAKNGLIPENVYVFTSVSLRKTRSFNNEIGNFTYRKIKKELFTGYQKQDFVENLKINIATPAKALFDFFYFKPFESYKKNIDDFRINFDVLKKEDFEEFLNYVDLSKSSKMEKTYKLLKKIYDRR